MANDRLDRIFEEARSDRSRGSRELLVEVVESLLEELRGQSPLSENTYDRIVTGLARVRPEMSVFRNAAGLLLRDIKDSSEPKDDRVIKALESRLDNLQSNFRDLLTVFQKLIERYDSLLLYSRSGTVIDCLESTENVPKTLHVLESRPGCEGADVANQLGGGHEVVFYYDVEMSDAADNADAVLLGCDSFMEDGSIVNKVGTRLLCETAEDTDVIVCTERLKLIPKTPDTTDFPTVESPEDLDSSLSRFHSLFEVVPPECISRYLTDDGIFDSTGALIDRCDELLEAQGCLEEFLVDSSETGPKR